MAKTLYCSENHWNQYRIASHRAPWWDYGQNGAYFVTICTKHRFPFFGEIQDGQMHLSEIGQLVQQFWDSIPDHTLPGVRLEAFVIMPNHLHGILVLDRVAGQEPLKQQVPVQQMYYQSKAEYEAHPPHPKSKHKAARSAFFAQVRPRKGSLPQILRSFKAVVTKTARQMGLLEEEEALWQSNYYDRVIRNEEEQERIAQFIEANPSQWPKDDYYYKTVPTPSRPEEAPISLPSKPKPIQLKQLHRKQALARYRMWHRQKWVWRKKIVRSVSWQKAGPPITGD